MEPVPDATPLSYPAIVALATDDVPAPIRRGRDPVPLLQEERLLKKNAADRVVSSGIVRNVAVAGQSDAHLLERRGAVLLAKRVPDQAHRQGAPVGEDTASDNEVSRTVKLEKEDLAGLKSLELDSAARLPEVHLVDAWTAGEETEPVGVGDTNKETHTQPALRKNW